MAKRSTPNNEGAITQSIADKLISMPKYYQGRSSIVFEPGMNAEEELVAVDDPREIFRLIIDRGKINPAKAKYMTLARRSVPLLRLELGGNPHRNPDGLIVLCPHLHRYREGFGDRWAEPISDQFGDPADLLACLVGFMRYCNVVQPPEIEQRKGLLP